MEQLDKWNKEMRRLSVAKFAETDDALYNYYKEALKSLKAEIKQYTDNYEQLSFSKRLEVDNRLKTANRIDGILNDLNSWSDAEIRRYIENEIEVGYYGTWYALEGAENVQLDFGILPERYIETLVNEKVNGQTFSKLLYKKRDELAERVTSALLTSAVNGKGYAYAAKEVGELTEASYKQALRIARTEGGRAQATAKQKAYKEATEKGVDMEKRWLSTLDKKTRHSHQELDGQTVAVDGQFNFNGYKADGPRLFKRASLDINCRCTTVAVVNGIAPDVRADNETKETIDYKTYNEWAEAKGYKKPAAKPKAAPKPKPKPEPKPKKTFDADAIMTKTNMREKVGEANYNQFVGHLNNVKDERIKGMYSAFGGDLEYMPLKDVGAYANGRAIQLAQSSFTGRRGKNPLNTVYHENGHAFDFLGFKTLTGKTNLPTGKKIKKKMLGRYHEFDETISHASALPEYNLKETIQNDLWRYINGDLPRPSSLGKKPRKAAEKAAWEQTMEQIQEEQQKNTIAFKESINERLKDNPIPIGGISDIIESTGFMGEMPFGWGHGAKYWKRTGNAEVEFFAHFNEILTTDAEVYALFTSMFPESTKICETIVDDILKKVGD